MRLTKHWFLLGLAAAAVLASVFPNPGARGGWMHPEVTIKAAVALVFFLHGVGLSFKALKAGSLRWPLHVVVQSATYVLFPVLGLAIYFGLEARVEGDVRLGLFFLCAVPSTVSSSVAFTAVAGGNVPGALFNATLSSLLGVFLTPLWVAVVMHSSGAGPDLGPVVWDLVRWLVLPLAVGQLLRPLLAAWATRHESGVALTDRLVILFLVYTSFCDSFREGVWTAHGPWVLGVVLVVGAALFVAVMLAVSKACNALGFSREDRIAALFCGSKKSLAAGVPMAKLIFGAGPGLGMIILPLMVYHSMQLVVCAWLAARWRKETSKLNPGI